MCPPAWQAIERFGVEAEGLASFPRQSLDVVLESIRMQESVKGKSFLQRMHTLSLNILDQLRFHAGGVREFHHPDWNSF